MIYDLILKPTRGETHLIGRDTWHRHLELQGPNDQPSQQQPQAVANLRGPQGNDKSNWNNIM